MLRTCVGHPGRFLGGRNDPQSPMVEAEFGPARTRLRLVASLLAFSPLLGLPV